ncbi:MAG: hypothetical protein LBE36_09000 [Flavobacteriaceae bacterium]|jgi:hypothetical protein|nr:hypothetical protein [Flavobacteriaceae bacterium]
MKIDLQKETKMMYRNVWIALVDIQAKEGKKFNDLIELDGETSEEYLGAWGNILVISDRINEVPYIIEKGLDELDMKVRFIQTIENVGYLVEYDEISKEVIEDVNWLLSTEYVFKISDKLFTYLE